MDDVMVNANGRDARAEVEAREIEELELRIKQEQSAIAEIEKRRTPSATDTKRAELEQLQRARRDQEVLEKLETAHGKLGDKIATAQTPEGLVAVRAPHPMSWRKFKQAANSKGGATADDEELLVRQCLIHPSQEEFNQVKAQRPGIVTTMALLAMRLGGLMQVELEGK